MYFSYYLLLFVCLFVSMFLYSGHSDQESLLINILQDYRRNTMKLYMMIAHGLPSCMLILTYWLWHRFKSCGNIRKFRKSSISPKLLDRFPILIPLCVGLCYEMPRSLCKVPEQSKLSTYVMDLCWCYWHFPGPSARLWPIL